MGVIVSGVVAIGGLAVAQNAGPSLAPPGAGTIIPVTGPTTVPVLPEPAKATATAPTAQTDSLIVETPAKPAKAPSAGKASVHQASHTATKSTVAKKPVAKTTAKKASGTKHVAKAAGTPKTKQVATTKHQAPSHHAAVSKPIPLTKAQPAGKSAKPTEPVLPRV
jgi:hypothetical protein